MHITQQIQKNLKKKGLKKGFKKGGFKILYFELNFGFLPTPWQLWVLRK